MGAAEEAFDAAAAATTGVGEGGVCNDRGGGSRPWLLARATARRLYRKSSACKKKDGNHTRIKDYCRIVFIIDNYRMPGFVPWLGNVMAYLLCYVGGTRMGLA